MGHMKPFWLKVAKSDNSETTVVNGSAVLHSIVISDAGTTETLTIKDGATTLVDAVPVPAAGTVMLFDIGIETSLKVTLAGSVAAKILITYDDS